MSTIRIIYVAEKTYFNSGDIIQHYGSKCTTELSGLPVWVQACGKCTEQLRPFSCGKCCLRAESTSPIAIPVKFQT